MTDTTAPEDRPAPPPGAKPNLPRLELHIPEPPSRPDTEVDFRHVNRGKAGAVRPGALEQATR